MANTVLGKVSCVPRGDYSASATYTVLDIAGYQGGSYMALKTVTGVTPSNDGINWMQLSGPGLPGEQGEQGEPGAAAGFGQATATVDETTGTPSVDVTTSGPDTAKVFNFAFSGLKGETGAKGDTGDKGDTGATGPQGVSVTDAEINESGRLIITLSAGEPIDAGNAVGPVGAKGDTGATGPEGASVSRIERTSGTGAPGTIDTYTVYLTDGSTGGTFQVYNGANGTGSGDFMADGSVPMTGALQMGGNKITNLGAPGADTDAVRKQDLDAVADEVDKILDGTTPAYIPPATTAKLGGVIVGDGLSVKADGTVSADSQLPGGGTNGQILTKTANGETWADPPDTGVTTFNNRSGAVTPQAGDYSADMIEFADGETFQQKYDAGELTGPPGADGAQGPAGTNGVDGKSAYQTATDAGYTGTEAEFNAALKTLDGAPFLPLAGGIMAEGALIKWQTDNNYVAMSGAGGMLSISSKIGAQISTDGIFAMSGSAGANFSTASTMMLGALAISFESQDIIFNNYRLQYVGNPTESTDAANKAYVDATKPVLRTATLTTSGWSGNSQTVTVNGIIADSASQSVDVVPADHNSAKAWGDAGVWCDSQGANTLTFSCESVPTANITLNIRFQEAQT